MDDNTRLGMDVNGKVASLEASRKQAIAERDILEEDQSDGSAASQLAGGAAEGVEGGFRRG